MHPTEPVDTPLAQGRPWGRGPRQALGAALIVLAFVPIYRLMDTSSDAPHREVSVDVAEVTLQLAWWGTIVTVLLAWLCARLLPATRIRRMGSAFVALLSKPSTSLYAVATAGIACGLSVLTGRFLYEGFFTNVDEIASTIHARYLASGLLGGPIADAPEAWLIPNTLMVAEGWVSHFPPVHLLAMAVMIRAGIPMLLGPLFAGGLAGLLALSLPRLLPEHPGPARIAALLVAVAPITIFLGGGSMSHVSAGAFGAAVLYAVLRARDGGAWWGVAAGAAIGLMVSDRPLIGLVVGTVFTLVYGVRLPSETMHSDEPGSCAVRAPPSWGEPPSPCSSAGSTNASSGVLSPWVTSPPSENATAWVSTWIPGATRTLSGKRSRLRRPTCSAWGFSCWRRRSR